MPPDATHGPYPLVLFAHGYDVTPDFYAPLLERWAAAGYVVAAPVFPILSGSDGGASHVDYEKTFGDASFVITQVLGLGAGRPARAGSSTAIASPPPATPTARSSSFGLGFLACCRDPRVKAVISMAGDLANANNPSVRDTGTPILHIMETNDEYDPYPHSIQWDRENLTAPRWMVSLRSSHVPPYTQPGDPAFELVSTITVAFLDGTLKGPPRAARRGDQRRCRRSPTWVRSSDESTQLACLAAEVGLAPGGAGSCRWRSGAPRRRRRPARGS